MGARHAARRMAAQALYALEMNGDLTPAEAADQVWEEAGEGREREFLLALVEGVWAHRAELDAAIERFSRHWKLSRMDRVDRSILRLASYELLRCPDVPAPVILDEGVELAKELGTPDSPSFVNGILDPVARGSRPPEELERRRP
ncbi:MAG: transcription antitermination factor NusB [Deferrisomatales bacterium]|nr:transcription antitermination factor NusB [Deferrisomatales bacterium]